MEKVHIYGFEEYDMTSLSNSIYYNHNHLYSYGTIYGTMLPYNYMEGGYKIILDKGLPFKFSYGAGSCIEFEPSINTNHKELLATAKKVYVHPSCKLSRAMLSQKYKKCNNPWMADVVVIPDCGINDCRIKNVSLFLNESAHLMLYCDNSYSADNIKDANSIPEGTRLGDYITKVEEWSTTHLKKEEILDAKFFYVGEALVVPKGSLHIYDILTQQVPNNKLVFESDIMATLSTDENKVTFESLTSIKEMLDSTDEDTVSAGFKALSMMDWMHYPNSIRYVIRNNIRMNRYNKAVDSTSVKYMLQSLSNNSGRMHWPGDYDNSIYEQDYELFKKLIRYYQHIDDDTTLLREVRYYDFMTVSSEGYVIPNLRKE